MSWDKMLQSRITSACYVLIKEDDLPHALTERGKDEYLWPAERLVAAYRRDPQWSQGSWPGCDPDWQTRVIPDANVGRGFEEAFGDAVVVGTGFYELKGEC